MVKKLIIAIDGPAGSGKSTSAKLVAQRLGFLYIDTGAMYRAVTYLALKRNLIDNKNSIIEIANTVNLELKFIDGKTSIYADGRNITDEIRTQEVNANVSEVSKIPEVRQALVEKQRQMGNNSNGVVMEGRDIGTVVFPNADVKIFMIASIDERAKRRLKDFEDKGIDIQLEDVKKNILKRDRIDSTRETSPLQKADTAIEVNTSNCTIDEQVNIILDGVKKTAHEKGIELDFVN